jgi:hypothetical protein
VGSRQWLKCHRRATATTRVGSVITNFILSLSRRKQNYGQTTTTFFLFEKITKWKKSLRFKESCMYFDEIWRWLSMQEVAKRI